MTYRIYISEALKAASNNICKAFGGYEIRKSFIELLNPQEEKVETRTPEEITQKIANGLAALREER